LHLQKCLRQQIERWKFPLWTGEAPVLRLRLDQGPWPLAAREEMLRRLDKPPGVPRRRLRNLELLLWRSRQMREPIGIGQQQRNRRNAATEARQRRMKRPVGWMGFVRLLPLNLDRVFATR